MIYTIVCFAFCSCLINRNQALRSEKQSKNQAEALLIDTLVNEIQISTASYWRDYKAYHDKRSPIGTEWEYIRVSKESFAMIERDGGMANIMKNILSKQNLGKLGELSSVVVRVTMSFDGSVVSGYCFSIRSFNAKELKLTQKEIDKFVEYFKQVTFAYYGGRFKDNGKFKDEIVPVGWVFPIRKIREVL